MATRSGAGNRSRWHVRVAILVSSLVGLIVMLFGLLMPSDSAAWQSVARIALLEVGTAILVGATIGVWLTEGYKQLRELTITDEIYGLVDRLKLIISHPDEFSLFQLKSNLDQAGIVALHPDRLGPAQDDVRSALQELAAREEELTVLLIGDTLRVFFISDGPFTGTIHRLIFERANVRLKVLLLNPNSLNALARSEAETPSAPFVTDEDYQRVSLFNDSRSSTALIREWNAIIGQRRGAPPIDLRFYDCADYCLGIILPDYCYAAQYIYADADAQVQTPKLPLIKFRKDSMAYRRLVWNFNYIWNKHSVTYEEVLKSMKTRPVVQWRSLLRQPANPPREVEPK